MSSDWLFASSWRCCCWFSLGLVWFLLLLLLQIFIWLGITINSLLSSVFFFVFGGGLLFFFFGYDFECFKSNELFSYFFYFYVLSYLLLFSVIYLLYWPLMTFANDDRGVCMFVCGDGFLALDLLLVVVVVDFFFVFFYIFPFVTLSCQFQMEERVCIRNTIKILMIFNFFIFVMFC